MPSCRLRADSLPACCTGQPALTQENRATPGKHPRHSAARQRRCPSFPEFVSPPGHRTKPLAALPRNPHGSGRRPRRPRIAPGTPAVSTAPTDTSPADPRNPALTQENRATPGTHPRHSAARPHRRPSFPELVSPGCRIKPRQPAQPAPAQTTSPHKPPDPKKPYPTNAPAGSARNSPMARAAASGVS